MSAEGRTHQWTPAGLSTSDGPAYHGLAFGPDGGTLWATPSSSDEPTAWNRCDLIDLASGTVGDGPRWDTGVATHPAGGLVATLRSDQGATLVVFAPAGPAPRFRSRALVLDADGYETPVFSADGRHLAIAGNAYENLVQVFEFPSLRRVLAVNTGEDRTRPAVAFGAGALWAGTPNGTLAEIDVDRREAVEHPVFDGAPVTAVAAAATGELVVAGGDELVFLAGAAGPPDAGEARVAEFLAATTEVTDDDFETVPTPGEPTWLRLQTALDARRG
ncbi:hypothetical protein [Amycolatopsis sp. cmx-4-68]|uniref:hypothetical protein n=1 Tax=Amycolatopsis sp. cmx-4-68 TaxID=2790938 RepID=UPI00397D769E